jgi:hypothetical protein
MNHEDHEEHEGNDPSGRIHNPTRTKYNPCKALGQPGPNTPLLRHPATMLRLPDSPVQDCRAHSPVRRFADSKMPTLGWQLAGMRKS